MRLSKIMLKNFRCFEHLELDLHPEVTVIVAENGQGKSSVLDALRINLWPFVSSFDLARNASSDQGNNISLDDVRLLKKAENDMVRQLPTEIALSGDFGAGSEKTWVRYRDSETKRSKTKDKGATAYLRQWATTVQKQIREPDAPALDLPVFGYYSICRLCAQKKLTESGKGVDDTLSADFYIRTFAYLNCLDPASTYKHFKEWFTWASFVHIEQLISHLTGKSTEEAVHDVEAPVLAVRHAIDCFLRPITGWHSLEYSHSHEKSLVLRHPQLGTMKVEMLSDGIRSVLAMIGDIAYRCIRLNPHLGGEAPQKTEGVVLIDEIDMHLHPHWQQVMIGQLREAFPKIQFIVTTHSPQVLTSVDASCIRLLRQATDPETGTTVSEVAPVTTQTRGVSSADLLARIMNVDPVPAVPEAQMLADYQALIQQNLHDSDDGQALRTQLVKHFGAEHPVMRECDRLVRLQGFKQRLPRTSRNSEG